MVRLHTASMGRSSMHHSSAPCGHHALRTSCCPSPSARPEHRGCKLRAEENDQSSGSRTGSSASSSGPNLLDPVQTVAWGGTVPRPRRLLLSALTGTAVILGGNLGGVTSRLLGQDGGKLARKLQLDALFPIDAGPVPFKRCIDGLYGYEFTFPATWLADQTIAYRAARRAEEMRGLDLPPVARMSRAQQRAALFEPVAAYGPPGSTGEENMSVIVAPIYDGFSLSKLGSPELVAQQFLEMLVPPTNQELTGHLIGCSSREGSGDLLYYTMEYTVQSQKFFRHNLSVITSRNNLLYTFNAQVPQTLWERDKAAVQAAADSFELTSNSRLDTTGFPARL